MTMTLKIMYVNKLREITNGEFPDEPIKRRKNNPIDEEVLNEELKKRGIDLFKDVIGIDVQTLLTKEDIITAKRFSEQINRKNYNNIKNFIDDMYLPWWNLTAFEAKKKVADNNAASEDDIPYIDNEIMHRILVCFTYLFDRMDKETQKRYPKNFYEFWRRPELEKDGKSVLKPPTINELITISECLKISIHWLMGMPKELQVFCDNRYAEGIFDIYTLLTDMQKQTLKSFVDNI